MQEYIRFTYRERFDERTAGQLRSISGTGDLTGQRLSLLREISR